MQAFPQNWHFRQDCSVWQFTYMQTIAQAAAWQKLLKASSKHAFSVHESLWWRRCRLRDKYWHWEKSWTHMYHKFLITEEPILPISPFSILITSTRHICCGANMIICTPILEIYLLYLYSWSALCLGNHLRIQWLAAMTVKVNENLDTYQNNAYDIRL